LSRIERAAPAELPSLSAQAAWFYVIVYPQPATALSTAGRLGDASSGDAITRRIVDAARLAGGDEKQRADALADLQKLAVDDVWAAVLVAERLAAADPGASAAAMKAGFELARSGRTGTNSRRPPMVSMKPGS
jgi:hypothetical protein